MNIIISIGTLGNGGAERVVSNLANSFTDKGHNVELLLYYDRLPFYNTHSKVKMTIDEKYIGKASVLKHVIWRRRYIKNSNADIIISFLAPFNIINIVALFGLKIPLIVADRNDPQKVPTNRIIRGLRDFLYLFADGVVLQSENNKNYFSKMIQKRSTVIFNPIDVGASKGAALKCEYPKKVIVSVGRLIKQKNPLLLVQAFAKISPEFQEYKLVFYGEGNMRDEIASLAAEYGLSNRVELPGSVKNIFELIINANLYVMTSDYEGMPNALLEAMCIGLPVISTKVSGATDVIKSGKNGLLVECGDVWGLVKAMDKMLSDSTFRRICGENAAMLADKLQMDSITNQWLDFIRELSNKDSKFS